MPIPRWVRHAASAPGQAVISTVMNHFPPGTATAWVHRNKRQKMAPIEEMMIDQVHDGDAIVRPIKTGNTKKRVKVSKAFREKVKASIQPLVSAYAHIRRSGEVATDPTAFVGTKWADTLTNARGAAFSAGYGFGTLNFNSPRQILDIASVLYNAKAYSADYTLTTNNLTTTGLIVNMRYVKHTLHFWNNSMIPRLFHVYEATPKVNTTSSFNDVCVAAVADDVATGAVLMPSGKGAVTREHPMWHPYMSAMIKEFYKYRKTEVMLEPGQRVSVDVGVMHWPQYRYNEFVTVAGADALDFAKNLTTTVSIRHIPYECYISRSAAGGVTPDGTKYGIGRYTGPAKVTSGTGQKYCQGVSCEIESSYDIICPDLVADENKKTTHLCVTEINTMDANANINRVDPINPQDALGSASDGFNGTGTAPVGW